jgi:hypothetical protein
MKYGSAVGCALLFWLNDDESPIPASIIGNKRETIMEAAALD